MNLLFDFITVQKKTGAGEYQRKVFFSLMDYIASNSIDINLYALFDSTKGIAYEDLKPHSIPYKINFIDIANENIISIIQKYNIDKFFIACAQYIGNYQHIDNLKCNVVCIIHDLAYEELYENNLNIYFQLENPYLKFNESNINGWQAYVKGPYIRFCKWLLKMMSQDKFRQRINSMRVISSLVKKNNKVSIITVSEYTKYTLSYHYKIPLDKIQVLYSPERISIKSQEIQNKELNELISSNKKFYLMVSADREAKNPKKLVTAAKHFIEEHPSDFFVTIGYPFKEFKNHLILPFLSESDLEWAYSHCYALIYPSYFEGFGYPPVEAMKYSKPILASNTTSIPEILGKAPIYFSPLYCSDIYKALCSLTNESYPTLAKLSKEQYELIHKKQNRDLATLITILLS